MQEHSPSACTVTLDPPSPKLRKLKSFFKNVLSSFEHMKSRKMDCGHHPTCWLLQI